MNVIAKAGYLGIDESNHGRFPEIFVAVHSEFDCDTKPAYSLSEPLETIYKKQIPKVKKKRNIEITDIVKKRDFKYLLLTEDYKDRFGYEGVRAIAYAELIKSFSPLELVLIDREIDPMLRENIARIVHPLPLPDIIAESNADHRYPVVNMADHIARKLFRYYQPFKNERAYLKYADYMISPMKSTEYAPLVEVRPSRRSKE